MNSFTFNGINSYDMGMRIEGKDVFSSPAYDMELKAIPGRDGEIINPNYRYPNVNVTYTVFVPSKSIAELNDKIRKIKQWLYKDVTAYHELTDTYDTDSYRSAVFASSLDIEEQLNKIGTFTVRFSCYPYKFLNSGKDAVTISSGGGDAILDNPTIFDSKPLIRINGNGEGTFIIVNNNGIFTVRISDINSYLYCDSELMNFYKGSISVNDKVTADKFPVLAPGENHIVFSGGITSLVITPRWVTL